MDRYDPYTDTLLRDTQYNILGTNLAEVDTDCISRRDAIDELVKMLGYRFQADEEVLDAVVTTINELPSAQPEIICCKDCKYYQRLSESCRSLRLRTGDEWYCADAERKVTT